MVDRSSGFEGFDLTLRLAAQETVFLAGDDTLLARCGLKIVGVGKHRAPASVAAAIWSRAGATAGWF